MAEGLTRDNPVDAVEAAFAASLDALVAALPAGVPHDRLISAVSGGPDSMCLAALAGTYAAARGLDHRAIIIDHGIRPESAGEAARVRSRLRRLGMRADIVSVADPAPDSGIQAWARSVRYAHLLEAARRDRAVLLLGHHRDDQAETVMMRLSRGSGLAGLAAMRGTTMRDSVPLLRPLLDLDRDRLRRYCAARGIAFESDPSNVDRRFERVRVRQWLAAAEAGVQTQTRSRTRAQTQTQTRAQTQTGAVTGSHLLRLSHAAATIDDQLIAAFRRHHLLPLPQPGGHMILPAASLQIAEAGLMRLLGHAIGQVTAAPHPPTAAALARLAARLCDGRASTLGGARFTRHPQGWLVTAEAGRRPLRLQLAAGQSAIFAGTWRVASPVNATVRRLGEGGSGAGAPWRECRGWMDLPPLARRSVPVLETLDGTLLYPHLLHKAQSCEKTDEAVAEFLPCSLATGKSMVATSDLKQTAAGTPWPGAVKSV